MFLRMAIALLAAALLTAQQPVGAGLNFYSLQKEAALGEQMAGEVRAQATVLDSATAQDYLKRLGQRIAAQLPGPKWAYSFTLVANDEGGSTHEPMALPAGYIFVPAGLVLAARDEGELAGMMAHAMAHASERDWTRQATRGELMNISMTAASQSAGQSGVNGMTADSLRRSTGLQMPAQMLTMARRSHLAADTVAAKAMAGAGFDPEALVRYLDREQRDRPGTMAATFSEMPERDARLAALRAAIKGLRASAYAPPNPEFTAFQQEMRQSASDPPPPPLKRDSRE
ncbi:MAG: M48 family metalloprotease [Bryobacteraceae bacterium]|jgi:predicted Zn-dependent protease